MADAIFVGAVLARDQTDAILGETESPEWRASTAPTKKLSAHPPTGNAHTALPTPPDGSNNNCAAADAAARPHNGWH